MNELPSRPDLAPLARLLGRLRVRLAVQRGLARGLVGLGLTGLAVALTLGASVLGAMPPDAPLWALGAGLALTSAAAALAGRGLPDALTLAARVDAAAGLPSDLGNAVAFAAHAAAAEAGSVVGLTVARGLAAAQTADWRPAAPWRLRPLTSGIILVLVAGLALPLAIAAPRAVTPAIRASGLGALPTVEDRAATSGVRLLEADARRLADAQKDSGAQPGDGVPGLTGDGALADQVARVDTLVNRVLSGALSHEEALAELGALDAGLAAWEDSAGAPWQAVLRQVAEAAARRAAGTAPGGEGGSGVPAIDDALKALGARDWDKAAGLMEAAAKAMGAEALAEQIAKTLPRETAEKAADALRSLAEDLKTEAMREEAALAGEAERLKKKQEETRLTPKERERLEALEKELEGRKREKLKVPESMRHLAELARQFEGLAREMMERYDFEGEGGVGPRDAQRQTPGGEQGAGQPQPDGSRPRGPGQDGSAEGQNGNNAAGQGQNGNNAAGQGQNGNNAAGQGQDGGGQRGLGSALNQARDAVSRLGAAERQAQAARAAQQKLDTLRDMLDRSAQAARDQARSEGARGASGEPGGAGPGAKSPDGGTQGSGQPGGTQGSGGKPDATADGKKPGGAEGAGAESGLPAGGSEAARSGTQGPGGNGGGGGPPDAPNAAGIDGRTPEFLPGHDGPGQSRTRLLEAAAERGVRTPALDAALRDYRAVAEDALRSERIPAGKRGYVRRYFETIQSAPQPPSQPPSQPAPQTPPSR